MGKASPQAGSGQRPAAAQIASPRQQIVQGQAEAVFPGGDPGIVVERDDEAQGVNEMGTVFQEQTTFMECFINEVEAAMLQVTQAAVNQLGRGTAGTGSKVPFVDQADAKATQHSIEGDPGPRDAAAENEEIEGVLPERIDGPLHERILAKAGTAARHASRKSKIRIKIRYWS